MNTHKPMRLLIRHEALAVMLLEHTLEQYDAECSDSYNIQFMIGRDNQGHFQIRTEVNEINDAQV